MNALPPQALHCPAGQVERRVAHDDFRHGLTQWRVEAQDPRSVVTASAGMLDMQAAAGLTLWWRGPEPESTASAPGDAPAPAQPTALALAGDVLLRFTATPLPAPASAGALAGRVSDLNMFWRATEADGQPPRPRSGAFAAYDTLRSYYVGYGANGNATTRLRYYDGSGRRRLLQGWADPAAAESADRHGPMTPDTRLVAGQPLHVQLLARTPTADDPAYLRWSVDGRVLFTLPADADADADAGAEVPRLVHGGFALRTTASRFQFRAFEVWACRGLAADDSGPAPAQAGHDPR